MLAFYIYDIWWGSPSDQEMNVVVEPENVVQVEMSDVVRVRRDPYSVATDRLYDLHNYRDFEREYKKLKVKEKLNLVSKIVEKNFI